MCVAYTCICVLSCVASMCLPRICGWDLHMCPVLCRIYVSVPVSSHLCVCHVYVGEIYIASMCTCVSHLCVCSVSHLCACILGPCIYVSVSHLCVCPSILFDIQGLTHIYVLHLTHIYLWHLAHIYIWHLSHTQIHGGEIETRAHVGLQERHSLLEGS